VLASQNYTHSVPDTSRLADNPQVTSPAPVAEAYKISPDDLLDVYIVDVPEYSRSYRVAPDGTIRLPLIEEPIVASGQTVSALATVISRKLSERRLLNDPHILVEVKQSRAHSIAIAGAVKNPQNYEVLGRTTLLNAISQAGGLTDDASNTAIIKRGNIGSRMVNLADKGSDPPTTVTTSIDLRRLMLGDQSENADLFPGDSILIQPAGVVYVLGAVNRAGGFVLNRTRADMTVLKALALAENLKSVADPKKAVIIRKKGASPNGTEELPVNLTKMLSNRIPDTPLVANDILFVPESTGKKVLHRTGEAAVQAATVLSYGVVIYR
jgi:polysaccharide biosynthesis/export protein